MSYVGNISDDPMLDFMFDTLIQRGHSQDEVEKAVERWYEEDEDWEMRFYAETTGPAIDALEEALAQGVPHGQGIPRT